MTDLGAYYRWRDNQPVAGLGAYYRWRDNQAISGLGNPDGLGATPMQLSFAEEALVELLDNVSQVLAVVTPWGTQTGDVTWDTIAAPEWDIALYGLTDHLLATAENSSYGHPVGWVAVLSEKAVSLQAAEAAFVNRRYAFLSCDVVYRQDDPAPTPKAYFLYWAQLRDDPSDQDGGTASLESTARQLGGQLVFAAQIPRSATDRAHPALPVQTVVGVQSAGTPVVSTAVAPVLAPGMSAPVTTSLKPVPASAVQPAAAAGSAQVPGWLVLAGIGAAAYVGWRIWGKK